MIPTIEWRDGRVRMLDQTRLPEETVYIDCKDYLTVAKGIKELWIRGAPAIGIAAAMGVALGAESIDAKGFDQFYERLKPICETIRSTRPTAVNLFWAVKNMERFVLTHRDKDIKTIKDMMVNEAKRILEEDVEINKAIGKFGAEFVKDGDTIHTHCNAGALATGGYGTALGVIRAAWESGKDIRVIADETRPVLQGARLTSWELIEDDIPVTLITDNMAGYIMKKGMIDLCVVGADRITSKGDVANKIGTYSIAVLAKHHRIPFYVAAPISTIDFSLTSGEEIPIEERDSNEVTHISGKVRIAPENVDVLNPAFDVTPCEYISAIITERGAFKPEDINMLKNKEVDLETM